VVAPGTGVSSFLGSHRPAESCFITTQSSRDPGPRSRRLTGPRTGRIEAARSRRSPDPPNSNRPHQEPLRRRVPDPSRLDVSVGEVAEVDSSCAERRLAARALRPITNARSRCPSRHNPYEAARTTAQSSPSARGSANASAPYSSARSTEVGVTSLMIACVTAARSRWPAASLIFSARFVFSQSGARWLGRVAQVAIDLVIVVLISATLCPEPRPRFERVRGVAPGQPRSTPSRSRHPESSGSPA